MTVPSYISLEKGDEAASKFSEKKQQLNTRLEGKAEAFDRINIGATNFFHPNFCSFNTCIVHLIQKKTFIRIFSAHSFHLSPIYFETSLVLTSVELSKIQHIIFKSLARISRQQLAVTRRHIRSLKDLNNIYLKKQEI